MKSPSEQPSSKELLRRIRRTCEMSAGIMRDSQRTGGWEGSEKVARQFDRIVELVQQIESTGNEPTAVQRKFLDLPKGTRFRYIGGKDVWVVLENYGLGLIAAWHGIEHGNKHQSLCIADETEEAVRNLVVEVVEGHAPPPEVQCPGCMGPCGQCDQSTDEERIDFLERFMDRVRGEGKKWDTIAFDSDRPVREQIDERIAGVARLTPTKGLSNG